MCFHVLSLDGPRKGRGRVALSATAARRSRDGSSDAGLAPPAGGPSATVAGPGRDGCKRDCGNASEP
eukprot:358542-Chlamydomonas_euryale.AAC.3